MILTLTSDPLILRKLAKVATEMSLDLVEADRLPKVADLEAPPAAVVVELSGGDGLEVATETKGRWPQTMLVGVLAVPDPAIWAEAEDLGFDMVTTKGAIGRVLPKRLEAWQKAPGGRRLRLFAVDEVAGRLGVVKRLDHPETGPVAVYHLAGDLVAVSDLCPHAGAMLSHGEVSVDDGVVTCPEHGSRFDTRSGERVRGPADLGLKVWPVVVEDGQAYLRLDPA
jgi:nitrite reductase/ring-hydroxylating ferredoxin subunit